MRLVQDLRLFSGAKSQCIVGTTRRINRGAYCRTDVLVSRHIGGGYSLQSRIVQAKKRGETAFIACINRSKTALG